LADRHVAIPRRTATRSLAGGLVAGATFTIARLVLIVFAAVAAVGPAAANSLAPWSGGAGVEFSLEDMTGGRAQLSGFRHRVVLLHFFATWCEPCRAEMASLRRLSERHAGRPLAIVAVNVAEVKPRVERFFAANPVSFPILLDTDRAVARAWRVEVLPTTIILDAQSAPIFIAEGDVDWGHPDIDAKVMELLAKSDP
jgi:thiol-disulfide isomerase/thioredoxin